MGKFKSGGAESKWGNRYNKLNTTVDQHCNRNGSEWGKHSFKSAH